jgi:acetyl esterase/lipase
MTSSLRWSFVSYQPIAFIYQLLCFNAIAARLPVWLVIYTLFPGLRPHRKWSIRQSVMVRLVRAVLNVSSNIGITQALSLKARKEKDRFSCIEPFPASFYKEPLKSGLEPAVIGGTWYPGPWSKGLLDSNGSVVLHLHGGAFVIGDGRFHATGFLSNTLIRNACVDFVFCPQYRLCGYGSLNPFPAALQDALTSYLHLIRNLGIPPSQITVSGDSAGANLAIGLLRYLGDYGAELEIPLPASAVMLSPWVSPHNSIGPDITSTSNPHWSTDYLPHSFTKWGANTYAQMYSTANPYISPLGNPFTTSVPIYVNIGAAEMLEIDVTRWTKEMMRLEGNRIEVSYEENAPHDTLLVGNVLGWEESARNVAYDIGSFIRKNQLA